jgi:iron complex transport system ATP-binding protein
VENVLKLDDVCFSYSEVPVINRISFEIKKGEFSGLIGPNGSGKSTIVKLISRYLKINSGRISYNGRDIYRYTIREFSRDISVLPQSIKAVFAMKVFDFVLLGRLPYKNRFDNFIEEDIEEACRALKLTDTFGLKDRTVLELSGGEWQRVVLSQALCQTPKVLLLDEPTTHLDIGHQTEVMDILYELNKSLGITILMIIHDLNIASEYCEKIFLIDKGLLKYSGTPSEVLNYNAIEDIYKVKALVYDNPTTKKPYVFPIPGRFVK